MTIEQRYTSQPNISQLHQWLNSQFNYSELRTLCSYLEVDFDNLAGETKQAKAREMLLYLQRYGGLSNLFIEARRLHPDVSLPFPVEKLPKNPYLGLMAFQEKDANNFFGREHFVKRLEEAIYQRSFVALVGASGSGKSSIIFAGLLPRLRQQDNWLIISIRPKIDPFLELARALVPLLTTNEIDILRYIPKLAAAFMMKKITLSNVIDRISKRHPETTHFLLIIDQFEEIFSLCSDTTKRQGFFDIILSAVTNSTVGEVTAQLGSNYSQPYISSRPSFLNLILALRADFLSQALAYRPLADRLNTNTEMLGAMNHEELVQVIKAPATNANVRFEAGLIKRILNDVGDEPGNLPLLQFALDKLWGQQSDGYLTHVGYEYIGQVQGALTTYADQVYNSLNNQEKAQARHIFTQLTQPTVNTTDTRRLATHDEVGKNNWPLVVRLASSRLLVTSQDENRQEIVELVHEALIQHWGQLQKWIELDRAFREWQERLRFALRSWLASQQDNGALLRGVPLGEAKGWLDRRGNDLTHDEKSYIELSLLEQRKRERRTQIYTAIAVGGAFLFLILSILLGLVWQDASTAEQQRRLVLGQSLIVNSSLVEERNNNLELATLLALEAHQITVDNASQIAWLVDNRIRELLSDKYPSFNHILTGHNKRVLAVAIDPDHTMLATASEDNMIKLWDLHNLQGEPMILQDSANDENVGVWDMAFSPDGTTLAAGNQDGKVYLWDLSKPSATPAVLSGHTDRVLSVAFSPDSSILATGSDDNTIRLWNISRLDATPIVLNEHTDWVTSLDFSPDGTTLVSGSRDTVVYIWQLNYPVIRSLDVILLTSIEHQTEVWAVAYHPDGAHLALGGNDGTVQLWDLSQSAHDPVKTLSANTSWLASLDFSSDGTLLAIGSDDGSIHLWNLKNLDSTPPIKLTGHSSGVWKVKFSQNGTLLVSGSFDKTVRLWDLTDSEVTPVKLHGLSGWVTSLDFSIDGLSLASGVNDNTVTLWPSDKTGSLDISHQLFTIHGHEGPIWTVAMHPNGQLLATGSADRTVRLWNLDNPNNTPIVITGHNASVSSLAFSPDGTTLATGSDDQTVRLWNLNNLNTTPIELIGHESLVLSVAISPDGTLLASGSADGTVRLWDLMDPNTTPIILTEDEVPIWAVAFNPDGTLLAAGSDDSSVRLWNLNARDNSPIALLGHGGSVKSVEFSPNGKWLASGSNDNTVRLWNVHDYTAPAITLSGHTDTVWAVTFNQDSTILASGSEDGTVHLWTMPEQLIKIACQKVGRNLSLAEWQLYLGNEPYEQTCKSLQRHASVS